MGKARAVHPEDLLADVRAIFEQEEIALLPVANEKGILVGVLEKESVISSIPTKKTLWQKLTK